MKRGIVIAIATAIGAFVGCPPQLSGEPCQAGDNEDCPFGQSCVSQPDGGATCQTSVGTSSGTSGTSSGATTTSSTSGGTTSGRSGIYGVVSINSGLPVPPGPTLTVFGFVNPVNVNSATPDIQAVVYPDGTFQFADAGSGTFYLTAHYDFTDTTNGSRVAYSGAITEASSPIPLDVATYSCTVVSSQSTLVNVPRFLGAIADVRDVVTGDELTSGANIIATANAGSDSVSLSYSSLADLRNDMAPFYANLWGYQDLLALNAKPVLTPPYTFVIAVDGGYPDGGVTCISSPSTGTLPAPVVLLNDGGLTWYLSTNDTLSWSDVNSAVSWEFTVVRGINTPGGLTGAFRDSAFGDGGSAVFPGSDELSTPCPETTPDSGTCSYTVDFYQPGLQNGLTGFSLESFQVLGEFFSTN